MANQFFGTDYPEPEITYQQRGTSAGSAYLQHWQIRLNPVLLQENQQPFIDEVVPHELAHLLVFRRFGRAPAPHGKEWRWMMEQVLGVSASRTHKFETASVQSKTYPYLCACQEHQLTVRRHNRVGAAIEHFLKSKKVGDALIQEQVERARKFLKLS